HIVTPIFHAQKGVGYGEIMFSLSYLPTAERLTVVVVKARSLQWTGDKTSADPFVKRSVAPSSCFPQNIQLRVTVAEYNSEGGPARSVGHVIVGTQATGKALSHWNQMMSALRKPIGMWHPLRR
ncbi:synaptotagmin-12-like, partial [Cherax quadricarinatus]|uniref:synaptotagmin-12-like n=1 Tax=Cherax quadricarinatus TaxID=27406 RepID=UPI00387EE034